MWLLNLLSCVPVDAVLYEQALKKPDFLQAFNTCGMIREQAARLDCQVASMERFDRLDREDCDQIPAGVWHEECLFLYAERQARAGNHKDAVHACNSTGFARECSFHLIRAGVRQVVERPASEAAQMVEPYRGMPFAPDVDRLFWKTWWRERLERKMPLDPASCSGQGHCEQGAREVLYGLLEARQRAELSRGESLCVGPDQAVIPPILAQGSWVEGEPVLGWIVDWQRHCQGLQ